MARILVVDDEKNNRLALSMLLKKEGYTVEEAKDGKTALQKIDDDKYDLVITDLIMKDIDGLDVLEHVKKSHKNTEVIVLTAYASVDSAVKAMRVGAYDYIEKGGSKDETLLTIEKALEKNRLLTEVSSLKKIVREKYDFQNIIGKHSAIQKVFKLIETVSELDVPVLISGESGTGKEMIARAIHFTSSRSDYPFIVINCGAMPENLQESELFGHVKGAFTGAFTNKIGLFREAEGGTLFMDEVSEMSPGMQVKLLRVLQDGEVRAVGGNVTCHVNTRLIFASNKDLQKLTLENKFREDLLYRINVIKINLPPLRQRRSDIPLLVNYFLEELSNKFSKKINRISSDTMSLLMKYNWPGNVRELKNVIERAVILTKAKVITPDLIELDLMNKDLTTNSENYGDLTLRELEKKFILEKLEKNNWIKAKTASELGISTATLWRKLNSFDISS